MHWNHRVIRHTLKDGEILYAVREVYYGALDDGPEKLSFTLSPDGVQAEDLDGLRQYCQWILASLDKPVLTPADFSISEEQAIRSELDDARAEIERLRTALADAIQLAEDAIPYVSEYLQKKWGYAEELATLHAALGPDAEKAPAASPGDSSGETAGS